MTRDSLVYNWTVTLNGILETMLLSESRDPSKFRLSAYRLTPMKTYDILLTVTNTLFGTSSFASVSVFVQQGAVVAQVSGGSVQSIRFGGSLVLDASNSYDQDVADKTGTEAGLAFAWSCENQIVSSRNSSCPFAFSNSSLPLITLHAPNTSAFINTTATVTVRVSSGTRTSSTTVLVTVQDSSVPLIAIAAAPEDVNKFSVNKRFRLSASLSVQSSCTAVWSVNDPSINMETSALTPVSSTIPDRSTRFVDLVLAANTLPPRASLLFVLACGPSKAVTAVLTNGPPLPGLFSVAPTIGVELNTSFGFSASFWSDPDLPISFQFGFESPSSVSLLTVRSRSELSFTTSTLAAGPNSTRHALMVCVQVFDALDAVSIVTSKVVVRPQTNITALRVSLTSLLSSSADSIEGTKTAISVGSSVINAVSCSNAPDCTSLNRGDCAEVEDSCGACLSGYMGELGNDNSQCFAETGAGATSKSVGSGCATDVDCGDWQVCNTTMTVPQCYLPTKRCPNKCSGHGIFVAQNVNSGKEESRCDFGDPSCVASCACDESFSGANCATTSAELREKQALRSQFLQSLQAIVTQEDFDSASVATLSNSLTSLAQDPYELSADSVDTIDHIAQMVLSSAATLADDLSESASGVLDAIDAAITSAVGINARDTANSTRQLMENVALFTNLVQSQLVAGQDSAEFIQDSFRLSLARKTRGLNNSFIIASPKNVLEQSNSVKTSSVTIETDHVATT
eukprot:gene39217-biopygen20282